MAWNGSNGVKQVGKCESPKTRRGLIVGLIVILAGITSILLFKSSNRQVKDDVDSGRGSHTIREVSPELVKHISKSDSSTEIPKPATTNSPKWEAAKGLDPSLFPYTDGRKVISTFTNNWDQIVDICVMPNGRSRKVLRNAKPPVFEHVTDQILSIALSGNNDQELPPIPIADNMEIDFLNSLKTPIVINDDDSDAIRKAKENVIEARKIMDAELRKGRSFKTVLEEHLNMRKENAELRQTAMDAVRELQKDGDPEMVNAYVEKVNGLLHDQGVGGITAPVGDRKKRNR